jgi:hypothetical protein
MVVYWKMHETLLYSILMVLGFLMICVGSHQMEQQQQTNVVNSMQLSKKTSIQITESESISATYKSDALLKLIENDYMMISLMCSAYLLSTTLFLLFCLSEYWDVLIDQNFT